LTNLLLARMIKQMTGAETNGGAGLERGRVLAYVGGGLSFVLAGAGIGGSRAVVSLQKEPVDINVGFGINATVEPVTNQPGLMIQTDQAKIEFGKAKVSAGILGKGIFVNANTLPIPTNSKELTAYTTLITHPQNVTSEVKSDFIQRIEAGAFEGALLGLTAGGLAVVMAHRTWRRQQRDRRLRDNVNVLEASQSTSKDPQSTAAVEAIKTDLKERRRPAIKLPKKMLAGLAGLSLLGGYAWSFDHTYGNTPVNRDKLKLLDHGLEDRSDLFKGVRVNAQADLIANKIIVPILDARDKSYQPWQNEAREVNSELVRFAHDGGLDYQKDPDAFSVLDLSGIHCNHPYMEEVLPIEIQWFKPDVVLISGDIRTNGNTLKILENNCFKDIQNSIWSVNKNLPIVEIGGNHDSSVPLPGALSEKNGFTRKIDGFDFVGVPSPLQSTISTTQPADPAERMKLIARQGDKLAYIACKAMKAAGPRPIALAHEEETSYKTLQNGCASVIDTAHAQSGPNNNPEYPRLRAIKSNNGKVTFQQTEISAAGADGGLNQFTPPQRNSAAALQIFSRETHELSSAIRLVLPKDGQPHVEWEPVYNLSGMPAYASEFLDLF
jgi:hypothetical protein